jgi:lysophospholipase L1-like esterase
VDPEFWTATDSKSFAAVRRELTAMDALCDARGTRLALVVMPEPTWTGPGRYPPMARLAALLDELDVPFVDPQLEFLPAEAGGSGVHRVAELWLSYDLVHPSAVGHALIARAAEQLLESMGEAAAPGG